jgi:hypothetical protein
MVIFGGMSKEQHQQASIQCLLIQATHGCFTARGAELLTPCATITSPSLAQSQETSAGVLCEVQESSSTITTQKQPNRKIV